MLANSVMVLVDAMVKRSEQQLSDSGKVLQEILSSAADANGEWYLPLSEAQVGEGQRKRKFVQQIPVGSGICHF